MKKQIRYTDEPLGRIKVVDDFLPPPSELAYAELEKLQLRCQNAASISSAAKRAATAHNISA